MIRKRKECKKVSKLIKFFSEEEVSADEKKVIQQHTAYCSHCQSELVEERKFDNLLANSLKVYQLKRDLVATALTQLPATLPVPTAKERIKFSFLLRLPDLFTLQKLSIATALVVVMLIASVILVSRLPVIPIPTKAKITKILGAGVYQLSPGESQWQLVKAKSIVQFNSKIKTDLWSEAELNLGKGVQLLLYRDTELVLSDPVELASGQVYVYVRSPQKTRFRILANGVEAEAISTEFLVSVEKDGIVKLVSAKGAVQFKSPKGTVLVPQGYSSYADANIAPNAPIETDISKAIQWAKVFQQFAKLSERKRKLLAIQYCELALRYYKEKKYDLALANYTLVVLLNPTNFSGYYGIALTQGRLKNYDKAILAYRKVLEINPQNLEAEFKLAEVLVAKGEFKEAKPHLEKLVKINPNDHAYAVLLGEVHLGLGNYEEAEYWYTRGLNLNPCEVCRKKAERGLSIIRSQKMGEKI